MILGAISVIEVEGPLCGLDIAEFKRDTEKPELKISRYLPSPDVPTIFDCAWAFASSQERRVMRRMRW